ncbi:prolipoprotein diacylglyceryl transferase [Virgibacillus pantothenticus]|uniref:Phosphatidylglycerol--prolipoprotein diacylglyceryl transferase n=1 Tax=Virgibacillus pantothenticus TaxID=1473 RepID=A0A0L0QME1_VIRPA|nr:MULTISPECIES: prolipoprotein diacylglyceryl transferase [Virgibacillus]API93468.1 prolipoprotein diacylglyceryl transferase [Virgibacillus sp. 6R]KNE19785.1 diacylglyceryl transferase [Virgibacillus pantothenticus]MBS7430147.1 prolipoprotein diacylglyceryl transferase [Virgibacillus sp. 19R1-5]MED3737671.1 prolipoprotein diacylglyceryl transferase [Virgibacillus pantothenticus]QTY14669.1 prolipoprotein diacylglyceryl transferase [Virgibacillus pantothenticus]
MSCSAEPLDRVFLQIGSFPIYWYGVIIAAGAFLGLLLANREASRIGMKKDIMVDLVVFAIPIAIISARIYYVIFEWDQYAGGSWTDIVAIWEGGIAIHGALIGAVLTAIVYARVKNESFWQLADIAAPSLILAQAIGRWGNFMNQEAHGGPISSAAYESFHQYLPDFIMNQMCIDGVMYHPTFLYESVWNILVFALLLLLRRFNPLRGEIFLSYAIMYSIGRFFIEDMRTDSLYVFGDLRQAQVISIVIILVALILIIYRRRTSQVRYLDIMREQSLSKKAKSAAAKNKKKKKK